MSAETIFQDVRVAFRAALKAVDAGAREYSWEGFTYYPKVGEPFWTEVLLPISSTAVAVGNRAEIRHVIQATVTLWYPSGRGTDQIETVAGKVLGAFRPGTPLEVGVNQAFVRSAERRPINSDAGYLSLVVIVTIVAYSR